MLKSGLMPHRDYRFPRCRDDFDMICNSTSCQWNKSKTCTVPSLCIIGENGKCNGYKVNDKICNKTLNGD